MSDISAQKLLSSASADNKKYTLKTCLCLTFTFAQAQKSSAQITCLCKQNCCKLDKKENLFYSILRRFMRDKQMAHIKFTPNLKRFFPDLTEIDVDAKTVSEVVTAVDNRWRGLADYIIDENGALRKHVNIFVGDELIHDKIELSDAVSANTKIYIMQALSGG